MNCQDISRLIDSGKFSALADDQHRNAETHALSCRRCAPLWIMHARVAATTVPAMPAELSVRCFTLVAARSQGSVPRRASRRMMFVVGGLVALAAAASMLALNIGKELEPQPQEMVSAPLPAATPAEAVPAPIIPDPPPAPQAAEPAVVKSADYSLPLLPAPIDAEKETASRLELATRKALDLYPEITNGPENKGIYHVMLVLRADGTVLRNSMVIAANYDEVNEEMRKAQATGSIDRELSDGSGQTFTGASKGSRAPDGRVLRNELSLGFSIVPDNYDPSRSSARVKELILAQRSHLMLPISNGGINTLTVLLSEDGAIQREKVEFMGLNDLMQKARSGESDDRASRAQDMARKLEISVDQIGLMGEARLDSGSAESPGARRMLTVEYAWPRKKGEAAPRYGQGESGYSSRQRNAVDTSIALKIVERMLPEILVPAHQISKSDGLKNLPTVVLSTEGRVLGAGRINLGEGEAVRQDFQRIVPGVEIYTFRSVDVRNSAGDHAVVYLAWEATPEQKIELEKVRKAAADK